MTDTATAGPQRRSFAGWAVVTVPLIVGIGSLMGYLSNSGYQNDWFAMLVKPAETPPGWVFGTVWPLLYILLGLAAALVLAARHTPGRRAALMLFAVHMLGNFAWSPLFFRLHQVTAGFWLIVALLLSAILLAFLFARIRRAAAWLLVPYMVWLSFAAMLNLSIDRMNPNAEVLRTAVHTPLSIGAAHTHMG